ncbi:hypothetical protein STEG23_002266 [Scotinomys teguina]
MALRMELRRPIVVLIQFLFRLIHNLLHVKDRKIGIQLQKLREQGCQPLPWLVPITMPAAQCTPPPHRVLPISFQLIDLEQGPRKLSAGERARGPD